MILERINLTRRLIAALGDALYLAQEVGALNRVLEFRGLRIAASLDLGEMVRNAYNNGGITEAQAQSAMRPIYSSANEEQHTCA
ncbi:hypothetical protein [Streptomyces chrestomyceticus]|uniref:hypothetical protein n=1 Tax=Streptomyces chrestomyceticus TaxID=68185 RepID=UPI0019D17655|nr:hypothetical protein [Streptomyces chrestomyceticus]